MTKIIVIINIITVLLKRDESVQKVLMLTLKTFQQVLYLKIILKQNSILWHFLPYNNRRQ